MLLPEKRGYPQETDLHSNKKYSQLQDVLFIPVFIKIKSCFKVKERTNVFL